MSRVTKKLSLLFAFLCIGIGVLQLQRHRPSVAPQPPGDLTQPRPIPAAQSVYLEELTWMEVRDLLQDGTDGIIVPTGGIEQNGPYLALGKHNFILELTAEAVANKLGKTLVAPIVRYVPEGSVSPPEGHMFYPGTISIRESTFEAVLADICESLSAHGFKRIYLIGDSGGNQEGMRQVATYLDKKGVRFIPEYYNYEFLSSWLAQQQFVQKPEGFHDDLAFTAQVLARNPELARVTQRRQAGKLSINGISLEPIERFEELGRTIVKLRAEQTADAIRRLEAK